MPDRQTDQRATAAPLTPEVRPASGRRGNGLIRWRGLIPLALVLGAVAGGYLLFAEPVARSTTEEAATGLLGTEVSIGKLRIHELETTVEIRDLAIADPFDPMRNLIEAGGIRIELERDPLLQRKLIVRQLRISDVRTGTRRTTPARPVEGGGFAPSALMEIQRWRRQFDVPLLSLTPFDTVRAIVLDPSQLATVQRALALRARGDSVQRLLRDGFAEVRLQETLDSALSLGRRLQGADVRTLGLTGTRQAVADVRQTLDEISRTKARMEALERSVRVGLDSLSAGVRAVDDGRRQDYAFALGLLKLPTFDAPEIGNALFGPVSIDRFQQAMYWTELAQEYLPPGLRPRETPGPKRLRAAGSTVHFAKAQAHPSFLLRRGEADFRLDGTALVAGDYRLEIANVTSVPALVGAPMTFALSRQGGESGVQMRAAGLLERTGGRVKDSLHVAAAGLPLPGFNLPGVPFRAELGRGESTLHLLRVGDRYAGRWLVRSREISWTLDPARAGTVNPIEAIVHRVIAGLRELELEARISGTLRAPEISVRSNLDRAIAERLRAVAGEEIARAELRARAEVDRLAREHAEPVKAQVASLRADAERRLLDARAQLDEQQRQLDAQLRALTGGIGLPRI